MEVQMTGTWRQLVVVISTVLLTLGTTQAGQGQKRRISMEEFQDEVRGAWAGQMIGVTYGAPTEFRARGRINDAPRHWKPEELAGALDQDDLYVEMTFAKVMDTVGLDATSEQYGEAFRDSRYHLWHANMAARRLLRRGIKAPMSGEPEYNFHANDIDFQIESDFIGIMSPGLPRAAQRYADRVGRVMNYGDGVYGGMFVSGMYSAAYFETDPRKVVEMGLAGIPAGSQYARVIRDVLKWSAENPNDWRQTWKLLEANYDKDDVCPDGALDPFNIDASLNGAYIALGLLYGHRDFEKTMEIAMRSGQDSDCNPSSAAGVLGAMIGFKAIPSEWTAPLAEIADKKFSYTDYSYNSIVASTIARAKKVVVLEGGTADADGLSIPIEKPEETKLEQFLPGRPVERIKLSDARWKFEGNWQEMDGKGGKKSSAPNARATATFEGTGAIVYGLIRPDGGLADVYLDGKRVAQTDAYYDEGDRGEGLWGRFDLSPGVHTVAVVVKGEPFQGSKGSWVYLRDLIVYRK
jgi:hypothetical protein